MTMDHDMWGDWPDGDDGGLGDGGLGDAETEDLGGDDPGPALESWDIEADDGYPDEPPQPADAGGVGFAGVEAGLTDAGPVDAHVDEPLGLPDADPPDAPLDPIVGTDPDADPHGWDGPDFPPPLDLDALPEPVDGPPWSDAALLGEGVLEDPGAAAERPDPVDLFDYAGLAPPAGGDPWAALLAAEDPATSALARWWAPR